MQDKCFLDICWEAVKLTQHRVRPNHFWSDEFRHILFKESSRTLENLYRSRDMLEKHSHLVENVSSRVYWRIKEEGAQK